MLVEFLIIINNELPRFDKDNINFQQFPIPINLSLHLNLSGLHEENYFNCFIFKILLFSNLFSNLFKYKRVYKRIAPEQD